MTIIFASLNAFILLIISLLHFYWMLGGAWGFKQALPTTAEGKFIFQPKTFECGVVAIGLLGMSFYTLIYADILPFELPFFVEKYTIWLLASIFMLRAVGDFRFVGFTKSIKTTEFAQLDTQFYAPLCLYLSIGFILIGLKF